MLLLVFAMASCKKEPIQTAEPRWNKVSLMDDAQIILNMTSDGHYLYCIGGMANTRIDSAGKISGVYTRTNTFNRMPANGKYKIEFSEDNKFLYISSYLDFDGNYGTNLNVTDIDPSLQSFNVSNQTPKQRIAINDDGQVLLSAMDKNNKHYYYLISFNIHDGAFNYLPSSIIKINLPALNSPPNNVYTFNGDFFITGDSKLYKINKNGAIVSTIDPCSGGEMFTLNGKLYLVNGFIWTSLDNGSTFPSVVQYNASLNGYYFRVLNGKIMVFVPYEGVGLFEFTPTGFTIKSVRNKGLENTHITAIAHFNNKLYVSTLSGLYYLDWKDVLF